MTSDNTIAQVGIVATGTIKNDKIDGTSRNDVLDGGAGSDEVKAGSGNDTLIYTMAQNAGARDRYDGGSDTDTLRLNFTTAEWASAAVKADVARYVAFLAPAASGEEGEHEHESAEGSSDWFAFKAFGLQVRNVEKLQIYVNNVLTDPTVVTIVNHAPVVTNTAAALLGAVTEDAAALTTSGQLSATDADAGATLAWSVQGAAVGTYGSLALNSATGQWTYTLNNSAAVVQALAAGETHSESFTVRVTDDKGAFVNQTVVVTVNGSNDAAVLSSAVVALTETNAALTTGGTLTNSDIDSAQTFVAQSNVAGANGTFSISSAGVWTYTANSAFDSLNVGQSVSDSRLLGKLVIGHVQIGNNVLDFLGCHLRVEIIVAPHHAVAQRRQRPDLSLEPSGFGRRQVGEPARPEHRIDEPGCGVCDRRHIALDAMTAKTSPV